MAKEEVKEETQEVEAKKELAMTAAAGIRAEAEKMVKEETIKANLEVAVLTCQGWTSTSSSWSRLGLYWHAPAGVVRSRDCGSELEGCSRSLVAQVSWFPIQLVFILSDLNSTFYIILYYIRRSHPRAPR